AAGRAALCECADEPDFSSDFQGVLAFGQAERIAIGPNRRTVDCGGCEISAVGVRGIAGCRRPTSRDRATKAKGQGCRKRKGSSEVWENLETVDVWRQVAIDARIVR